MQACRQVAVRELLKCVSKQSYEFRQRRGGAHFFLLVSRDALGFGVPVFAFGNDRARRLLGDAGIIFNDKRDPRALAGVAAMLLTERFLIQ